MIDLALTSVVEHGVRFETGVPVTFRFVRNTEKSDYFGSKFGQDIEPAGRFMLHNEDPGALPRGWETGIVSFENPLVIRLSLDDDIYGPNGWKARLRDAYKATGARLSRKLLAEGYDAIVTVGEYESAGRLSRDTREIVDLRALRKNPYFHGSKTPLEVGTILRPKPDGYVQQQYENGEEDNWVERAMEKGRPKDKLSRLESVFMLKLEESELRRPDLSETFDQTGGYGEYIYEVEPLGRVERSDMKNYTMAAYPEAFFDKNRKRYRAMAVEEYWSGDDADGIFEYRTPAARVVRLVGGSAVKPKAVEREIVENPRSLGKCRVQGCGRDHYARGWCMRHYTQWLNHGRVTPRLQRDELALATKCCRARIWPKGVPISQRAMRPPKRCPREAVAEGYCRKHITQIKVHGRLTPERELGVDLPCKARGCPDPRVAKGYCMWHYNRRER